MTASRADLAEIRKKVELYISVNRFDAAEKLLKTALNDHGALANLHNLLGVTYHRQSRFPDALNQFNKSLAANPEFVEAGLNLAATLCDLSRYDEAQLVHEKLIERINPRKRQPALVLGRLANQHAEAGSAYEESGMTSAAIQEYRKALGLYERMPDVKLRVARLYLKVGENEKARKEFEEIVDMQPESADEALTWLGVLYYKMGHHDRARQCFERAAVINPNNIKSRAYLKLSSAWTNTRPPTA